MYTKPILVYKHTNVLIELIRSYSSYRVIGILKYPLLKVSERIHVANNSISICDFYDFKKVYILKYIL